MPNTQQILTISIPMLLLAGAIYITHRVAAGENQKAPMVFHPYEDNGSNSSPIIVGDGSINVRQFDNLIHEIDGNHAYVSITAHAAALVIDKACPPPTAPEHDMPSGKCTALGQSRTLTAPWNIQLLDSGGKTMGNIGASDSNFPGFILFTTVDSAHTMVGREPDNGGDGEGFVECAQGASKCTAGLAAAIVTLNNGSVSSYPLCNTLTGGQHCLLKIAYCDGATIGAGNCK
jgi:hypothetical protein